MAFSLIALTLLGLLGCCHIGPGVLIEDRLNYNEALATTWKEQTLLNIVKIRYLDAPFFVDVSQIVSAYAKGRTCGSTLSTNIHPNAPLVIDPISGLLQCQHSFADQPTIAYAPQTNAKFVQNLTLPLPPSAVLYLMQSGYPVDVVFDLILDSFNGLQGRIVSGGQVLPASQEFRRVGEILRKAQLSGQVGMRIEVDKEKKESLVLFIRDKDIDPGLAAELTEVRKLLRLKPGERDYRVVFGATPGAANEITMLTRSPYRILGYLSANVAVPEAHLAEGRAPSIGGDADTNQARFTVLSGCKKPKDCFAAICYRGHWFWIDDRDAESKRTMMFLMIILALADTGTKENVPFLTIPTR